MLCGGLNITNPPCVFSVHKNDSPFQENFGARNNSPSIFVQQCFADYVRKALLDTCCAYKTLIFKKFFGNIVTITVCIENSLILSYYHNSVKYYF